jgi:hypothetical protein
VDVDVLDLDMDVVGAGSGAGVSVGVGVGVAVTEAVALAWRFVGGVPLEVVVAAFRVTRFASTWSHLSSPIFSFTKFFAATTAFSSV